MRRTQWRWWHGLAFYGGVRLAGWALSRCAAHYARRRGLPAVSPQQFYRRQKLPWFAPPSWAFPVAWSVNSAGLVAASLRLLNLPARTSGRTQLLRLQAAGWVLFASFDAAYFQLQSPINAALVTLPYSLLTWASLFTAIRRMDDHSVAWALAPTAAWTALAAPLSVAQACRARDRFWLRH
jgi:tryptophan-rich sensory protein